MQARVLGMFAIAFAAAGLAPASPPAVQQLRADSDFVYSEGFLSAHPDQYYRLRGTRAREQGNLAEARRYFLRAARYADKLSQGAYAEMLWSGEGGEPDRALAYAWMDLAAERATPMLLSLRERYWAALSEEERQRAIGEGQAVYDEYADAVAKPRLERVLRAARRNVTGSRLGRVGPLDIQVRLADGSYAQVRGDRYYQDRYWEPEAYWRFQDEILANPPRQGSVEIGPIDALESPEGP